MRNYQTKSNQGALPDSITSTRFGAGEFNSVAVELEGAVTTSGQTLAPADGAGESTTQLSQALAIYGAGGAAYHRDTGAVNAYVLNPVSPKKSPNAYFDGFMVIFEPGTVNTTASTVNIASLGVKSITDVDGIALKGGEIKGPTLLKYNLTDDRFEFIYSGGYWRAFGTVNFYVDGSLGSDANDGKSSGAGAFATIQKAVNTVRALLLTDATINIYVADGTYNENIFLSQPFSSAIPGGNTPKIIGNTGDNTAVKIAPSSGDCVSAVGASCPWHLKAIWFEAVSGDCIVSDFGSRIYLENVNFGDTSGRHLFSLWGSMIEFINDGYDISGDAAYHAVATRNSHILMQGGHTVTLTGTPAFSSYFVQSAKSSIIDYTNVTFSGSATGFKAGMTERGTVYFPSNLPGSGSPVNIDYVETDVTAGSPVALTSGVASNVATISIGPGEYEIYFAAVFIGDPTTSVNYYASSISPTSLSITGTSDSSNFSAESGETPFFYVDRLSQKVGPYRVALTTTVSYYAVVLAGFGTASMSCYGKLYARRIGDF